MIFLRIICKTLTEYPTANSPFKHHLSIKCNPFYIFHSQYLTEITTKILQSFRSGDRIWYRRDLVAREGKRSEIC